MPLHHKAGPAGGQQCQKTQKGFDAHKIYKCRDGSGYPAGMSAGPDFKYLVEKQEQQAGKKI